MSCALVYRWILKIFPPSPSLFSSLILTILNFTYDYFVPQLLWGRVFEFPARAFIIQLCWAQHTTAKASLLQEGFLFWGLYVMERRKWFPALYISLYFSIHIDALPPQSRRWFRWGNFVCNGCMPDRAHERASLPWCLPECSSDDMFFLS